MIIRSRAAAGLRLEGPDMGIERPERSGERLHAGLGKAGTADVNAVMARMPDGPVGLHAALYPIDRG